MIRTLVPLITLALFVNLLPLAAASSSSSRIAVASFAPLNTDIFIADRDGMNARSLFSGPSQDFNPSFSADGRWIIFTSDRNGSADIFRARVDGSELEMLVGGPSFDDQGALSPDGKNLAFVSSRNGQADIWILDLRTRKLRNLTNHPAGDFRPAWSPDGKWIAFSSDRDSLKPKGNSGFETMHSTELYRVRPDGSGFERLTFRNEFAGSPRWSADGKRLVYYVTDIAEVRKLVSPRDVGGSTQIGVIDVASKQQEILTSGDGIKISPSFLPDGAIVYAEGRTDGRIRGLSGNIGAKGEFNSPSWSRDGSRMLFYRNVETAWPPFKPLHSLDKDFALLRTGVFPSYSPASRRLLMNDKTAGILHNSVLIADVDGNGMRRLYSNDVKSSLAPVWSPKGDRIAFATGRFFQNIFGPAIADIAIMNSDGTGMKLLTKGDGNYGFPSWSPDERYIVYRHASRENGGLVIIDVETLESRVLTDRNHDNFPQWSPRGDVIAFTSNRDGDYELYTIKPDGSGLTRLTNSPGNDAHSAWSLDGKWIAFSSGRQGFKDEAVLHARNPQPYGELFVMRADGSDVRMLTDNQWEEATPAWIGGK